jgi:hypothetical protein
MLWDEELACDKLGWDEWTGVIEYPVHGYQGIWNGIIYNGAIVRN